MFVRPHLNRKKLGVVVHICHPSNCRKPKTRPVWGKKEDPISKITRAKRAGGVAQEVQQLLASAEALSSNPGTTKNIYIY
jgi:hypothetical protein